VSRVRDIVYPPIIVTAKAGFKVWGLSFQITGDERVPTAGGAVLAVNHISYLDFIFAGFATQRSKRLVRFMAKRELFDHKVTGPIMRSLHHIEVDRADGAKSFNVGVDNLKSGEIVGIFPEATISRAFELKDFKTGAVRLAAAADVPVIPLIVWGGQRIFTKDHPRDLSRGKTIALTVGEPMDVGGLNAVSATKDLRAQMAALLDQTIKAYPETEEGRVVDATVVRRDRADTRTGRPARRRGEATTCRETTGRPAEEVLTGLPAVARHSAVTRHTVVELVETPTSLISAGSISGQTGCGSRPVRSADRPTFTGRSLPAYLLRRTWTPRTHQPRPGQPLLESAGLPTQRLRDVLAKDDAGGQRDRDRQRRDQAEQTSVEPSSNQIETAVDGESGQQRRDRCDHDDQRGDAKPAGHGVGHRPDRDRCDGRGPGETEAPGHDEAVDELAQHANDGDGGQRSGRRVRRERERPRSQRRTQENDREVVQRRDKRPQADLDADLVSCSKAPAHARRDTARQQQRFEATSPGRHVEARQCILDSADEGRCRPAA
jgi:1-acyl-sn-glycerol-3-phosphate acyltransferase